jgi:signal peptidase I
VAEDESTAQVAETAGTGSASDGSRRVAVAEWAITVILLLFVTTSLVQSYVIPTVSMEDTLLRGDHLLVDKLSYAPGGPLSRYALPYTQIARGDIVVFRWPIDIRQNYVKRVIGVPGDRLRVVNKQVYLNGAPLAEPYTFHKTAYFDSYRDSFPGEPNVRLEPPGLAMLEQNVVNGDVVVPPDHYFVMGDNRDNSLDSRYWGFVPRQNIIGKPLVIFWSYDAPTERLADPNIINLDHLADLAKNFFNKTRWNRTFRLIRGHPVK